jgi:uncharacterized membrane protein
MRAGATWPGSAATWSAASRLPSPSSHPVRGDDEEDHEEVLDGQLVDERRRREPRLDLQSSRYVSPLPSPDDLERYRAMLPDAPERLLSSGEREQAHRHDLERRLVALDEGSMPRFYMGQRVAHFVSLVLGLAYLSLMGLAIVEGQEWGIGGAAAGLAAVVWATRRDPSGPDDPEVSSSDPQAPEDDSNARSDQES